MSVFHGMDVAEVERLGRGLQSGHASGVRDLVAEVDRLVGATSAHWVGADAERFRSWWPAKKGAMLAMADDLHGFGQSALNNVSEQRSASGEGASSGSVPLTPSAVQPAATESDPAPSSGAGVQRPRTDAEIQRLYDAWASDKPLFRAGGDSHYQCTGWANFRWQELGYEGLVSGHGGEMADNAPGPLSSSPSLHAMASTGPRDRSGFGHVMIVEEISVDGSRIRVSEMNVGANVLVGTPEEYEDTSWIKRGPDGVFYRNGKPLRFAAFPG